MEMRFLITWAFSEPPAGAGDWLSCFHVEVLVSSLAWARAWAAAFKVLMWPHPAGPAGNWCREVCLWTERQFPLTAQKDLGGIHLTFCLSRFRAPDIGRYPQHRAGGADLVLSSGKWGAYQKHLLLLLPGRFHHVARLDRFRFRSQLPCVSGWVPRRCWGAGCDVKCLYGINICDPEIAGLGRIKSQFGMKVNIGWVNLEESIACQTCPGGRWNGGAFTTLLCSIMECDVCFLRKDMALDEVVQCSWGKHGWISLESVPWLYPLHIGSE